MALCGAQNEGENYESLMVNCMQYSNNLRAQRVSSFIFGVVSVVQVGSMLERVKLTGDAPSQQSPVNGAGLQLRPNVAAEN